MSILSDIELVDPLVALVASANQYTPSEFLDAIYSVSEQLKMFEPNEALKRNSGMSALLLPIWWTGETTILAVGPEDKMVRMFVWWRQYELHTQLSSPGINSSYAYSNYKFFHISNEVYKAIEELSCQN